MERDHTKKKTLLARNCAKILYGLIIPSVMGKLAWVQISMVFSDDFMGRIGFNNRLGRAQSVCRSNTGDPEIPEAARRW
jgi:hypothetical protein